MHIEYIDRFKQALIDTEFLKENATAGFISYEEGMEALLNVILEVKRKNKHLFFIGNGGSSAIASHMTADFMKNGGMKTYGLYDSAVITCMGNDYGYEDIFSKQLVFLAGKGDLLVAISSSGNSQNIVNAINTVKDKEGKVITFSGFRPDNRIKAMGDYSVFVPAEHYGIVESVHNLILQQVVDTILDIDGGDCMNKRPAVFLDRDGVLSVEKSYVTKLGDLEIFPFAHSAVKKIHEAGFYAIVITNQSAVARGMLQVPELEEMNKYLMEETGVDQVYYCPHFPYGTVKEYSVCCGCRKPKTGMIQKACSEYGIDLEKSYFAGDRESDVMTGKAVGIKTVLVESGYDISCLKNLDMADYIYKNIYDFSDALMEKT